MKKIMYALTLVAAVALATSCEKEKEPGNENPIEEPTAAFTIEVSDITFSSANIKVTPNDDTKTYFWSYIDKAYYDELGTDSANVQDDLDYYEDEIFDYLVKGVTKDTLSGLSEATDYYVYAYYLDSDGNYSDFVKVAFTTKQFVATSELTFSFEVVEDSILRITPSNNNEQYVFGIMDDETIELIAEYTGMSAYDYWMYYYEGYEDEIAAQGVFDLNLNEYCYNGAHTAFVAGYNFDDMLRTTQVFEYSVDVTTSEDASAEAPAAKVARKANARSAAKPIKLRK